MSDSNPTVMLNLRTWRPDLEEDGKSFHRKGRSFKKIPLKMSDLTQTLIVLSRASKS